MASNRVTSNGPDWKDVVRAANEFSRDFGAPVALLLRPFGSDKAPAFTVVAEVRYPASGSGVASLSVSASVVLNGGGVGALSAACLSALFELDKEVYRRGTLKP